MVLSNSQWLANAGGGYEIDQSIRFNKTDNSGLTVTPSAGNRDLFTLSVWFKLGLTTSTEYRTLFCADTSNTFQITFLPTANGDYLRFQDNGVRIFDFSQSLRDPSAWYHLVYAYDSAQSTAADRCKAYLNGEEVTDLTGVAYPAQNVDSKWNSAVVHGIGYRSATDNWDGYLAEIHHIEGTALDPTSFGEYNANGVWIPKAYDGSYGSNGFYITGETASDLGEDFSGNNNDFTSSGLATTDQMLDTPTNNYCVLSPIDKNSNVTLKDGNLVASAGGGWYHGRGTLFAPSGKWYYEWIPTAGSYAEAGWMLNVSGNDYAEEESDVATTFYRGIGAAGHGFRIGSSATDSAVTNFSLNDVIMMAIDVDTMKMWVGINGTWYNSGDPAGGTNPVGTWTDAIGQSVAPWYGLFTSTSETFNFGQRPFAYTIPTGFNSWNTANLPTPSITDGSAHFQPTLYTGNGTAIGSGGLEVNQSGNSTFQPDFAWIKNRTTAGNEHDLYDAVRGVTKVIFSSASSAEATVSEGLTAFDADGFTVGNRGEVNTSGNSMVAWQWLANGAGSSNTDGDITSTVSANTRAGFSIATYTGNASSSQTIGHGLGQIPSLVMFKELDSSSYSWQVYHASLGYTQRLILDGTNAAISATNIFSAAPTSTVFTVGNSAGINTNSASHVMYSFAEIPGYSSFGIYTGNGSADGPMIYTGFKPAYVLMKKTSAVDYWIVYDSARDPDNFVNKRIYANTSGAEDPHATNDHVDFLSNGFKQRSAGTRLNASGATYIYMAFAENPFGGDGVAPATAR